MQSQVLSALIGWGVSSLILMRIFWLPDPPPGAFAKWIIVSGAGVAGGVLGGLVANYASAEPMPGIFGAIAGSLVLVGLVRASGGR